MISNSENFMNLDSLNDKQKQVAYNIGINSNAARIQEKQDDDELAGTESELEDEQTTAQKASAAAAIEKDKEEVVNAKNEILTQDEEHQNNKVQNKISAEIQKEKEKAIVDAEKAKTIKPEQEKLSESQILENLDNLNDVLKPPCSPREDITNTQLT